MIVVNMPTREHQHAKHPPQTHLARMTLQAAHHLERLCFVSSVFQKGLQLAPEFIQRHVGEAKGQNHSERICLVRTPDPDHARITVRTSTSKEGNRCQTRCQGLQSRLLLYVGACIKTNARTHNYCVLICLHAVLLSEGLSCYNRTT